MHAWILFIAVSFFVVVSFAAADLFLLQEKSAKKAPLHHMHQTTALGMFLQSWNTSGQLVNLYTPQCAWLQAAGLCRISLLGTKYQLLQSNNCLLGREGVRGNPGRLPFWLVYSLPCSAPCGTEQTAIDTGCDPALPHNCSSSSRLQLQNNKLVEFARNNAVQLQLCCAIENHRQ